MEVQDYLRTFLIPFLLSRPVQPADIQVTEKLSFLDATAFCSDYEYHMFRGPFHQPPVYIRSEILRHQWDTLSPNLQDGLWIGAVKPEHTDFILDQYYCEEVDATADVQVSTTDRQCLFINMSTANDVDSIFNVSSCDVPRSYVCISAQLQALRTFSNAKLEGEIPSKEMYNLTEAECQDELLSDWYTCYAAEFTQSGDCKTFRTGTKRLPKNITLTFGISNSTVIMKGENQVILNTSSIGTFSRNVSFPCVNVSSATFPQTTQTTTEDQAIVQSTTTADQTILQSTTFPFTSSTEQNPSEHDDCLCICADNNINKTDIDIEKRLIELRNNLTIDKTVLTMNRMKRISAYDERTSSKALGAVGIGVICTVVIILFVFDTKSIMDLYIRNKAS